MSRRRLTWKDAKRQIEACGWTLHRSGDEFRVFCQGRRVVYAPFGGKETERDAYYTTDLEDAVAWVEEQAPQRSGEGVASIIQDQRTLQKLADHYDTADLRPVFLRMAGNAMADWPGVANRRMVQVLYRLADTIEAP